MDAPRHVTADEIAQQVISNAKLVECLYDTTTKDIYGTETYRLLEQAVVEIRHEKENTFDDEESKLQRAERYTGLHRNVLKDLLNRRFPLKNTTKQISRKLIHYTLYNHFFLEQGFMPTTKCIFDVIQKQLPAHVDIRSFRDELVEMGYIFKKTDLNTAVVIENPAIRFERYMYLKKIKEFREEGKPIHFVCEAALHNGEILNTEEFEKQQPGDIQNLLLFIVSESSVTCAEISGINLSFESYMQSLLTELVSKDARGVVVLDNSKRHSEKICEPPNANSLKCEMIEWLQFHHISFTETMNRFELWTLIERSTNVNANMYKIDNMVKTLGLEVLRIPDCINNLTPASYINDLLGKAIMTDGFSLKQVMSAVREENLRAINSSLIAEEDKLFELEIKIDSIIDTLSTSVIIETDQCLPRLRVD